METSWAVSSKWLLTWSTLAPAIEGGCSAAALRAAIGRWRTGPQVALGLTYVGAATAATAWSDCSAAARTSARSAAAITGQTEVAGEVAGEEVPAVGM